MDAPWESLVRQRLRESQPVFGCTITTSSIDMAVRAATAGFHFLWLELEHSPICRSRRSAPSYSPPAISRQCRSRASRSPRTGRQSAFSMPACTASSFPSSALRPSRSRPPRRAATRPLGRRGSGASLASASWPDPDLYADSADHNLLVVAIIEEESALAHADEIAATPGVDVVFAGTGDLSFSLGLRGDQRHPLVQESAAADPGGRAAAPQGGGPAGRIVRGDAALHRAGFSVLPGAVRSRAVRNRRAAVPRPARHPAAPPAAHVVLTPWPLTRPPSATVAKELQVVGRRDALADLVLQLRRSPGHLLGLPAARARDGPHAGAARPARVVVRVGLRARRTVRRHGRRPRSGGEPPSWAGCRRGVSSAWRR